MSTKRIHGFTAIATMTPDDQKYWGHSTIHITAELQELESGNPYFSVTGQIGYGRNLMACGCLHDAIRGAYPELEPIIALHLSNQNGKPMHAQANGWYWLAGVLGGMGEEYHGGNGKIQHWKPGRVFDGYRDSTPSECLEIFAKHCRIQLDRAEVIAEKVRISSEPRKMWNDICTNLEPEWAEDARKGIEFLKKHNQST